MGALAVHRQILAMARAAIGPDLDEPLDVHRNVLAQIALDAALAFDDLADAVDLIFVEVLHFLHGVNLGGLDDARGARMSDTVDVGQRDVHMFLAGKIHAGNTGHNLAPSYKLQANLKAQP